MFIIVLYTVTIVCRVEELTLINEHLQEQLAESRGNNDRLSGDVHRLSVSLSAAQNRASEMESEHRERLAVRTISQVYRTCIICRPFFTILCNLTHLYAFNRCPYPLSNSNSPLLGYFLGHLYWTTFTPINNKYLLHTLPKYVQRRSWKGQTVD